MVDGLLKKKLIRVSLSQYVIPTLLVPKNDHLLRLCFDICFINKIIIKYHFYILRLEDLLAKLEGSHIFSKLDLKSSYHQIQINQEMSENDFQDQRRTV